MTIRSISVAIWRRAFGAPVVVDNDVNVGVLGAAAALGHSGNLAYLSVGTGVAAGFLVDGQVHRGAHGAAGEIGHLPVDPGGPPCECGQRGCLEVVASGSAIARRWRNGESTHAAVSEMLAAAAAGDADAIALRDEVADHLAWAVALIAQTVDPDVIVLGGGVLEAGGQMLGRGGGRTRVEGSVVARARCPRPRRTHRHRPCRGAGRRCRRSAARPSVARTCTVRACASPVRWLTTPPPRRCAWRGPRDGGRDRPRFGGRGRLVGEAVASLLGRRPNGVLGLATGSSPLAVYRDIARRVAEGSLSLVHCRAFLLDEYVGLTADHPQSYRSFIRREFEQHVDISPDAVRGPVGADVDVEAACAAYEAEIVAAGGIDLQLLGIGTDGHVGFNEPVSSLASRTRLKTLTEQTRRDNARFFASLDDVPRHVVTQGIGTILEARHLVLLAFGEAKAAAVAAAVEGPLTVMVPASALQLHRHATVVIDETAASLLSLSDYYRETWAHKPAWQGL